MTLRLSLAQRFASLTLAGLGLCLLSCEAQPVVSIVSPAPGAYLSGEVPVLIEFHANAEHYQRVDLLLGDAVLGTVERTALFEKGQIETLVDFSGAPEGDAVFKAQAINLAGVENGSWAHEVFIRHGDTQLPIGDGDGDGDVDLGEDPAIDVASPADGERVVIGGATSVQLGVGAADTVVKIELFAGGEWIATLRDPPFVHPWDTSALPPGPVALKAVATFEGNVSLTDDDTVVILALPGSESDITPPTIGALTSSRQGDIPAGVSVVLSVQASDDLAISRLDLFLDGEWLMPMTTAAEPGTYQAVWSTAGHLGAATFHAVATDPAGHQVQSPQLGLTVVAADAIDDPVPPTVGALSVTPDGPVTQGDVLQLAVSANDDVGVVGVELYVDGIPVGGFEGAEPDYHLGWSTAGRSGNLSLEARALDVGGNLVSSGAVEVFVAGGDVIDWTPPPAHPFAKLTSWPTNTSGDQSAPNPGNLSMYLHVPEDLPPGAPIVVVMHGCSQTAVQFKNQSGWTDLADRHKWVVVFPEQNITSDPNPQKLGNPYRCFNWAGYYGDRMARGEGENQSIKEMVDWVLADESLGADASRVFVTGFSAGGGMTNLMAATWPEVFAGASAMAGIPYGCANSRDSAFGCMGVQDNASFSPRTGATCESGEACMDPALKHTPEEWGDLVRAAGAPGYSGPYPKMLIWHGDKDQYVDDDNLVEMAEQWANVHDASPGAPGTLKPGADAHEYVEYTAGGDVVLGTVLFPGMAHGIAVDPGSADDQGGTPSNNIFSGGYAFDKDLYAAHYTAGFWGILDWFDGSFDPGPDVNPEPDVGPEPDVSPEPDVAPEGCEDYSMTVQYHLYAFPARVENVGGLYTPDYRVVGSGESLNEFNIYFDVVDIRTTDVEGEYELGVCP